MPQEIHIRSLGAGGILMSSAHEASISQLQSLMTKQASWRLHQPSLAWHQPSSPQHRANHAWAGRQEAIINDLPSIIKLPGVQVHRRHQPSTHDPPSSFLDTKAIQGINNQPMTQPQTSRKKEDWDSNDLMPQMRSMTCRKCKTSAFCLFKGSLKATGSIVKAIIGPFFPLTFLPP